MIIKLIPISLRKRNIITINTMRKKIVYIIFAIFFTNTTIAQNNVGSGHTLKFDGSNGYVDLGDIYNNLYFPFTLSFWLNVDEGFSDLGVIFSTEEGSFPYRGFWARIKNGNIGIGWGDGMGGNNNIYRRVKYVVLDNIAGRWTHISFVANSKDDISIVVNGIDVGGAWTGTSTLDMATGILGDGARIGKFYSNGNTYFFRGQLDEIRLWNKARTINEIRTDMCKKINGNEVGLIGYWNFNETSGNMVNDISTQNNNGLIINNVNRGYSGAPIGDESVFVYNYTKNLKFENSNFDVEVQNCTSQGVHIYKINSFPSQFNGTTDCIPEEYFGVFTASSQSQNFNYDVFFDNYNHILSRNDNNEAFWVEKNLTNNTLYNEINRGEYIETISPLVNLGADTTLCAGNELNLEISLNNNESIIWNDGSSFSNNIISNTGIYWAEISNQCFTVRDSISVEFTSPPVINLGADTIICADDDYHLEIKIDNNAEVNWNNGSSENIRVINSEGIYWASASNICGIVIDTIKISLKKYEDIFIPNVFTPNGDELNQYFHIDNKLINSSINIYNRWGKLIYTNLNYQNDWQANETPSGVYYYTINDNCSLDTYKGTITIIK